MAQLPYLLNLPHTRGKLYHETTFFGRAILSTVMFTLILFLWGDAQDPEIYSDILVCDKTMIALM